ncbi:hypothetical protein N7454_004447 [Penicillium verhagenii]|nr:hypothetical protein N7454_004447 [Penicillium verhagenii]
MALDERLGDNKTGALVESDGNDSLFHLCWARQSCSDCLTNTDSCSWCAISSTCVPNPGRAPILAPIGSDQICPLGSKERWDLRARPLGCNVNTVTVLSVIVSIAGTIALIGIVVLIIWLVRRVRRRLKQTEHERLDDEPQDSSWAGWLDLSTLFSLAGLFGQGGDADADAGGRGESSVGGGRTGRSGDQAVACVVIRSFFCAYKY